jgi:DNA-binding transcriptional MerR regulator/methylmalonyl-CoA mutase cobalamin-binding subunit
VTTTNEDQARHPIGVVAERTGLSLDVLRVWERRYGVVAPERDASGRRVYTDADVERLRLLSRATAAGRSIGQLAKASTEELRELVRADEAARWTAGRGPKADSGEADALAAEAMARVGALDGAGLEAVLRRAAVLLGAVEFLEGVVAPLFRRIGEAWHEGRLSVAQEHLATGVARAEVSRLARSFPVAPGAPVLVVATPAGERHEVGALLVAAAAAVEGWRVAYLGADLPAPEIAGAVRETGARAVALSSVYVADAEVVGSEIEALRRLLPAEVPLLLGGAGVAALAGHLGGDGAIRVGGLADLRSRLREGAARALA